MTQKRSDKDYRPQIERNQVETATHQIFLRTLERLEEKGWGSWLSRHEILGFIEEEKFELTMAVHSESLDGVKRELIDIAVGCIFAIACIDNESLDW